MVRVTWEMFLSFKCPGPAPGAARHPDQLHRARRHRDPDPGSVARSAYGQDYLDSFPTLLGHVCGPDEQASVLAFLNSQAASYISGQVIWVDGGILAQRTAGLLAEFEQGS